MFSCLAGCLVVWFFIWLIGWFGWLFSWFFGCLIGWFVVCLFDLFVWLVGCLVSWMNGLTSGQHSLLQRFPVPKIEYFESCCLSFPQSRNLSAAMAP